MIGINGAAAHLVHPGDLVIIIAYGVMSPEEIADICRPSSLADEKNRVLTEGNDPANVPAGSGLKDLRGRAGLALV